MSKRRISDALRHALRRGRALADRPGVEALAVLVMVPHEDLRDGTVTGSMCGSPAAMTAMAGYLLKRVRDDAREHPEDEDAVGMIDSIDAALTIIFGHPIEDGATQGATLQ